MADGGGDVKSEDVKNAEVKSGVVRKPSRRSPTTGHRRKKTDLKRSQSSPREAIVPTSSDDEGRNVPVRRKSLSPDPGPEPKKVLRRRHRIREKSQETKDVASSLNDTALNGQKPSIKTPAVSKVDDPQIPEFKGGSLKNRTNETGQEPKDEASSLNTPTLKDEKLESGSTITPAAKDENQRIPESKSGNIKHKIKEKSLDPKDKASSSSSATSKNPTPKSGIMKIKTASMDDTHHASKEGDNAAKKTDQRKSNSTKEKSKTEISDQNDKVKLEEKSAKSDSDNQPRTTAIKDKPSEDDSKEDKTTKPTSWWGGWLPFRRKEEKPEPALEAEATGDDEDTRVEDYVTSDDETAAEFVKLLSGNNKEIKDICIVTQKISEDDETKPLLEEERPEVVKSWRQLIWESRVEFVKYKKEFPKEMETLRKLRNRCFCELLIMFIFCGCGAFIFKTTEGTFESFYKCGVKRVKRDFIDDLWRSSHFMKEEDWKSKARSKLWLFENQLQEAFEAGINTYSGQKSWSFINGIIYCLTVVTTIGYGHIAPVTNSGRALTIAYSIIGIPLFLILLADFGKLFTRCIKYLWAFVRRVYYTGSCKKVRRTGPVQEVMKGMQLMYETIRRPSMFPQGPEGTEQGQEGLGTPGDPPSTPALSAFAIDDEFNLPISVAITILLVYIFMGATVFWWWEEDWSFFESFYFVFISMSTIGFGDLVPKNQMYMMLSIVYLAFGLALTSMCINVVQEKLSDSFRKASAKIGATIGLKVSDDDGTISPVSPTQVEIAEVHKNIQPLLNTQLYVS